jgi:3-oxoacyl-[acyl-carrier-protein] synthase III
MAGSTITAWGAALPKDVLTNADLERRLDTTDKWIVKRTGIRERRVGGTTTDLAVEAAGEALDHAGTRPSEVDLLIVSTNTPDMAVPAVAAFVQHKLGLHCGAFDLTSGCSSFVYALVVADGLVSIGTRRVLIVASDTVSRVVDPGDRAMVVLFGDAAAAAILESSPGTNAVIGWDFGADGGAADILYRRHGEFLQMNGQEVFRRAVCIAVESSKAALENSKVRADEIALFVPHQDNLRIIERVANRLGLSASQMISVVDPHRQHLVCLHPVRAGGSSSSRTAAGWRSGIARWLRCWYDVGERGGALG